MLGEKLSFNPMMRKPLEESSSSKKLVKEDNSDNEEKNYEKIVDQKTAVINKKMPRMKMFNSKLNDNKQENIEEKKVDAYDSGKNEKVSITEKEKKEEKPEETSYVVNLPVKNEVTLKEDNRLEKEQTPKIKENKKSKFDFGSIIEEQEDNFSSSKTSANVSKPKTSLKFDFDDSEVIETPSQNSNTFGKNKLQETVNKKPAEKKIKFLFDDE